jgi:hypothetical protein
MDNKIKILVIGVMIVTITFGVIMVGNVIVGYSLFNLAEQEGSGVNIGYDVFSSQGQWGTENLSGMEAVKVNGTVWNTGDKEAKNVMITIIFTDTAHDRVVRKTVVEGVDLLPMSTQYIEFGSEYSREPTTPKTSVNTITLIEWKEDGQLKTLRVRLPI